MTSTKWWLCPGSWRPVLTVRHHPPELARPTATIGPARLRLTTPDGVGVQVRQLAGLDAAAFDADVEVFPPDTNRETEGDEPALPDHAVDRVGMEVEVPGRRVHVEPVGLLRHRT